MIQTVSSTLSPWLLLLRLCRSPKYHCSVSTLYPEHLSEKAASDTKISAIPTSGSAFPEKSDPEIGFPRKSISGIGVLEEPNSKIGILERPTSGTLEKSNLEVSEKSRYVKSASLPSQIKQEISSRIAEGVLTQDHVIEILLNYKHDPTSALKFFKWAEKKQRGFVRNVDALCVMVHILALSKRPWGARDLLSQCISGNSSPSASVLVDRLIESSKICKSDIRVFSFLLNCYIRVGRIAEAAESFERMIKSDIVPEIKYRNILLTALVRENMIRKARDLYGEMQERGVDCDCFTRNAVKDGSLKQGMPGEADSTLDK
uniref:Uncharacterized protein n=1 Tax=Nelumbo nucifera TaxID=4432 RepID=A0A822Z1E0_NELNU|nr:TPA_asm: hypothetical protein HUJ06_007950 [Nelumbo nucifera]